MFVCIQALMQDLIEWRVLQKYAIVFFPFSSQTGYICHSNPTITWLPSNISCGQHRERLLFESPAEASSYLPTV